jgi:Phosphoesterase family
MKARVSVLLKASVVCLVVGLVVAGATSAANGHSPRHSHAGRNYWRDDGLGIQPGKVKHVWLIVLENKAFDATFTGLNDNTYLWQTLPHQGALLKNYYGTGHSSLDNYLSLASGQAPQPDDQDDCPAYTQFSGPVDLLGSVRNNPDYGQVVSAAGPNAAPGDNGCVYPKAVPTLFNQLDAAHVSWKGYFQDLGNTDSSGPAHSAGVQYCGAPDDTVGPTGGSSTTYPNPSSANSTDQYVAKHNPLPWFQSILQSGDCNSQHVANVFDSSNGLYHDLQKASTTPAFSWITPNNCSDGHDAVCHGNNLSGGFSNPTTPNAPVNYTGGLYSADLFLEHVIPEIEASPAFREGGLIDITFDEAYPPFTYSSDSFANSTDEPATAATSLKDDSAGENLFGRNVRWEPTGPNVPLARSSSGQELYPGPGFNEYLDRPSAANAPAGTQPCYAQTTPSLPSGTCLLGGGSYSPSSRTDTVTGSSSSPTIEDNSIVATDKGRALAAGGGIPSGAYVGKVTDTPTTASDPSGTPPGDIVDTGSFTLVNSSGHPIDPTGTVTSITLAAETPANDPLYNADGAATGGGDTGSVLISPYIRPGTVSNRYYNHYSWLRTIEDLFDVSKHSPGLDGQGHIGYAAQPGLAPFGRDVFTNTRGEPWNARGYAIKK